MTERRGEKVGWIGGWTGGFVWLAGLAVVWLVQGLYLRGVIALLLFGIGIGAVIAFSPWRHPDRPYRLLMLPIYLVLFAAIAYAVLLTGVERSGLTPWSLFWLFPLLIPVLTAGARTWNDGKG